jgi:hypothetical protein
LIGVASRSWFDGILISPAMHLSIRQARASISGSFPSPSAKLYEEPRDREFTAKLKTLLDKTQARRPGASNTRRQSTTNSYVQSLRQDYKGPNLPAVVVVVFTISLPLSYLFSSTIINLCLLGEQGSNYGFPDSFFFFPSEVSGAVR